MDFMLRVRTAAVFILFSSMFKLHQCPKVSNRVRVRKLCGPYQDLDGISLFPGNAHTTSVSSWNLTDLNADFTILYVIEEGHICLNT